MGNAMHKDGQKADDMQKDNAQKHDMNHDDTKQESKEPVMAGAEKADMDK